MKKIWLLTMVLLLLAYPAYAFQSQHWQYFKPVSADSDGLALVQLDRDILEHSLGNFEDIRIVSEQSQELPYQVMLPRAHKEESYQVEFLDFVVRTNEYSSATLDLKSNGLLSNRITLDIEAEEDYLREVVLEGSNDNQTWSLIGKDKIFSVAPYTKDTDILYPAASFRYLRVRIDCKGEKPITITRVRVSLLSVDNNEASLLPSKLTEVEQGKDTTAMVIDLGVKGYFVQHLNAGINGQNYNRSVKIFDSNDGKQWRDISSGRTNRLYHYNWPGYEAAENKLTVNLTCGRYIKLLIQNQDSPPLQVQEVKVWGEAPKLLADLQSGHNTLWYGNPDSKPPSYDLARFSHLVDKKSLPAIKPGHTKENPNFTPVPKPWTERNSWLLNTAVVGVAVILGVIIIRSMRPRAKE